MEFGDMKNNIILRCQLRSIKLKISTISTRCNTCNALLRFIVFLVVIISHRANCQTNVALNKRAYASKIDYGDATLTQEEIDALPGRVVDGNGSGNFADNTCAVVVPDDRGFRAKWEVDLENTYYIGYVKIYDTDKRELQKFEITVTNNERDAIAPCATIDSLSTRVETIYCDKRAQGRFLTIARDSRSQTTIPLILCEVEVYGKFLSSGSDKPVTYTKTPKLPERIPAATAPAPVLKPVSTRASSIQGMFVWRRQKGSLWAQNGDLHQSMVTRCTTRRIGDLDTIKESPFVHIDLHTGHCLFMVNANDGDSSQSSEWVVFEYVWRSEL